MANLDSGSPRSNFFLVVSILVMIGIPAGLTLHTARVSPAIPATFSNPSPYGYPVSLLLFIVPILVIAFWFVPAERLRISRKSFVRTIALLFPIGVILDFFFARSFLKFPNPEATLGIPAPALGGSVPIEEYIFYFTGFVTILLVYIWFDEYWLAAYSIPLDARERINYQRLLRFHPTSLVLGLVLIAAAIFFRMHFIQEPGFPGYFTFLVIGALGPSTLLLPSAMPVINWRAFSLTLLLILLVSLLWEATLAVPYGWWGYQDAQMIGIRITAWSKLPIEAVIVWIAVTYATAIVYEVVRRWQSSGKGIRQAFFG